MFRRCVGLVVGLLLGLALAVPAAQARNHVFVGVGIGAPWYGPGWYGPPYAYPPYGYPPYPVEVAPPVYVAPSPIYIAPPVQAPPVVQAAPAAAPNWYYCSNPKGYYPYVTTCTTAWREVPSTPPR